MELNIKEEPAEDYILILPKPTETEIKTECNPFGIKKCSVDLRLFDARWKRKPRMFWTFYACNRCKFVSQSEKKLKDHKEKCRKTRECEYCGKKFKSEQKLSAHNAKKIECQLCKLEFNCMRSWLAHR